MLGNWVILFSVLGKKMEVLAVIILLLHRNINRFFDCKARSNCFLQTCLIYQIWRQSEHRFYRSSHSQELYGIVPFKNILLNLKEAPEVRSFYGILFLKMVSKFHSTPKFLPLILSVAFLLNGFYEQTIINKNVSL